MAKKLKPDMKFGRQKIKLFEDLPELSGPIIRICSNREVSVDRCRGVVDYYENLIKLNIPGGTVSFMGDGLKLTSFTDTSALIKGRLQNVEFSVRTSENDN